jgi:L-alanine-DL-glutamate epimerase-like enolase superfamily enzyme
MKITDVKTVLLTGPSSLDPFIQEARKRRSAAFIEIHTDVGVIGLGETYGGYFCPEPIPAIVEFFKPILMGQDVENIPQLWQRMYHCGNFWCRVGLGVIVLNGIEAALWDLKGKLLDKPVYELLGGCKHAKLPCYATGGPTLYPKDRLAKKLDFYMSQGFRGFKVGSGARFPDKRYQSRTPQEASDFEGEKAAFMRSHCGKDAWLMMDGHMGNNHEFTWTLEIAIAAAKALEPYDFFFLEEPLHYTDPWGYAELCRATTTPIAGGECLTAMYEWRVFAEQDSFDIGQPDASFTGGLQEFMNVAALMAKRDRKIATHSWGAGGSLAQNLHAGFAAPNTCMLEVPVALGGLHTEVMEPIVMKDGYVLPPTKPGLGIVLTDETKNRYPFVPGSGEFNSVPGKVLVP